ncbi:hypothetical protein J8273_6137 [Carpediemonas membranifera]|uniref:Uncharacterized protein n=1 Tax=Carpediemonas membranifera TaxID=201153 RepID=A0A8J6AQR2_9EUKA|nr:hypothetical protein J8273_6137 [Carpediemonas membranifera]|eukprot:KAG9391378.1 hypothetical protein J8273_6137 [Carpediemonas membranifera]
MIRYDLKDGIVRLIRAVQLFKSELKQMGDAAQEIAELKSHRSTASRRIYCRRQRPRDSRSASARDHHDLEASCFIHYARRGGVPRGDLPQLQVQSNQWLRRTRSHLPPSPSPMGEGPLRLPSRLCCLHRGHGRPCRAPRDERDGDRDSRPPHPVQDPPPDREEHQARHRT